MRVAIVDESWHPFPFPRVESVDSAALSLFRRVLGAEAEKLSCAPASGPAVYTDKSRLDKPTVKPALYADAESRASIFQPQLEDLLRSALERHARVHEFFGVSARHLANEAEPALMVEDVISGKMGTLSATYLLGCDGAHGFVRVQSGLQLRVLGSPASFLVVDAEAPLDGLAGTSGELHLVADAERPLVYAPLGLRELGARWQFGIRPGEDVPALRAPERIRTLIAPFVAQPERVRVLQHTVYAHTPFVAERWRTRNVFLCGDSAHSTAPFLGGGLSLGAGGVANLCAKLELVWRGMADDALLDAYQAECAPLAEAHVRAAARVGEALWARAGGRGGGGWWAGAPWTRLGIDSALLEHALQPVVPVDASTRDAARVSNALPHARVRVAGGSAAVPLALLQVDRPKIVTTGVVNIGELEALQALPDSVRPRVFSTHAARRLSGTSATALEFAAEAEQRSLFGRAGYVVVLSGGRALGRYAHGEEAALVDEYCAVFRLKPPAASELALARARAKLLMEYSSIDLHSRAAGAHT